ncbi:MAG: phosphoribosylamine--glycine ligase [Candidatus Omnitrophica bacterium]|nr:phosphoribosylamine--glycine ligase [Candidatus Omnitrophota bacterium]
MNILNKMGNKVLIVGSGAREHALARAYLTYSNVEQVVVTPGNDGMIEWAINRFPLKLRISKSSSLKNPQSILSVAREYKPDLIDVAQDDALAAGTVDLLECEGFRVFGPTKKAAQIEWDKEWSREFMTRHNISAPEYKAFTNLEEGAAYAREMLTKKGGVFIKAAGLYAGKGVIPAFNSEEITKAIDEIKKMGEASRVFLVEEAMRGEEFSYYAIVDGKNFKCFKSAQDNKRVYNRDQGPNTGGMGANSPALVTKGLEEKIEKDIIAKVIKGMAEEGRPYKGILYLGGMVCEDGSLKVVEFNSRWGDPECHVILPGIQTNYFDLVNAAIDGKISEVQLKEDSLMRVCIIGASAGYPGEYKKEKRIYIENDLPEGIHFLGAGIKSHEGELYTNGGRVFSIIAKGEDVIESRKKALQGIACCAIEDNGLHYRTDIAWRDVQRLQNDKKII